MSLFLNPFYKKENNFLFTKFKTILPNIKTLVVNIEEQGLIFAENSLKLIGEGNEAKSKVSEISSTEFCIKISN